MTLGQAIVKVMEQGGGAIEDAHGTIIKITKEGRVYPPVLLPESDSWDVLAKTYSYEEAKEKALLGDTMRCDGSNLRLVKYGVVAAFKRGKLSLEYPEYMKNLRFTRHQGL